MRNARGRIFCAEWIAIAAIVFGLTLIVSAQDVTTSLNQFLVNFRAGLFWLPNTTADPGTSLEGTLRYDSTTHQARLYNGTTWGPMTTARAAGRAVAQTAAVASVAAYTVGSADGTFEVSANVLVTTATTHSFTVTCTYTDEGNTSRTVTMNFSTVAGVISNTAIGNAGGAVPYHGVPLHIRAKSATTITIATTGTFTTVTYNVDGVIRQLA